MNGAEFVPLSLPPILIGILAAIACALPGNFLVLRKQALIGDAISHVVLPGIVLAFLVTQALDAWAMLLGAGAAALFAVVMIDVIKRVSRIEMGAIMGVVFTTLFALGVLLLEQSSASSIHLDVEHALMGNLESLIWLEARGWASLLDPVALAGLPPELPRLALTLALIIVLLILFWRPLTLSTFDEGYAESLGLSVRTISLGLVMVAALAAVTAFDAVGSIIVIAMFICPAAAARLVTDRLRSQIWWSVGFATLSASLGYVLAGYGPLWIGLENSVSAAGMIAAVSGLILALTAVFGPKRRAATA
ncbi:MULTISPECIES: metal ABC transporter permease [unclassified Roseobacter]|uniref:metal ABC transporter permease n=1 Tax=unclassified Roseobacter TaxID=196798 RepID=UPI0030EE19AE